LSRLEFFRPGPALGGVGEARQAPARGTISLECGSLPSTPSAGTTVTCTGKGDDAIKPAPDLTRICHIQAAHQNAFAKGGGEIIMPCLRGGGQIK